MIEHRCPHQGHGLGLVMGLCHIVHWRCEQGFSLKSHLPSFIELRGEHNIALVAEHAIHHQLQVDVAMQSATRRTHRCSALARTVDLEFLRCLTGTHHLKEALSRAGVGEGAKSGWMIYLPSWSENEHQSDETDSPSSFTKPSLSYVAAGDECMAGLDFASIGLEFDSVEPTIRINDFPSLGITQQVAKNVDPLPVLLGHVANADLVA